MSTLVLKRANFDDALQKLKDFSSQLPQETSFTQIPEDGTFWGFTDHQVTGKEMNRFIGEIKLSLTDVYTDFHRVFKEFGEVYEVFNTLDKEYVAGILQTFSKVEEISTAAKELSEANAKIINSLQKTAEKFKEFKQRCEANYDSLVADIYDLQEVQRQFAQQNRVVHELVEWLKEKNIIVSIEQLYRKIHELGEIQHNLQSRLKEYQHTTHSKLESLYQAKEESGIVIMNLKSHCDSLSKENYTLQQRVDRLSANLIDKEQEIADSISCLREQHGEASKTHKQGLMISYALTGLSILLTVLLFIGYGG